MVHLPYNICKAAYHFFVGGVQSNSFSEGRDGCVPVCHGHRYHCQPVRKDIKLDLIDCMLKPLLRQVSTRETCSGCKSTGVVHEQDAAVHSPVDACYSIGNWCPDTSVVRKALNELSQYTLEWSTAIDTCNELCARLASGLSPLWHLAELLHTRDWQGEQRSGC